MSTLEITCPVCGADTLLRRAPKFDGFQKVGEELSCAECGHVFGEEKDVPFKSATGPKLFDESDLPDRPVLFAEEEAGRLCGHCAHYVVNPFRQWCGLHRRDVEATDTCPQFAPPQPEKPAI